jgi:hypothetical protein
MGTLGCIISDGEQDFALTVREMMRAEAEKVKADQSDVLSEGTKKPVVHPAHYDVVHTKKYLQDCIARYKSSRNNGPRFIAEEAELQDKLAQVKKNKKMGHLMYETTDFGGELAAEEDIRCCQLDYSLIKPYSHHSKTVTSNLGIGINTAVNTNDKGRY